MAEKESTTVDVSNTLDLETQTTLIPRENDEDAAATTASSETKSLNEADIILNHSTEDVDTKNQEEIEVCWSSSN